MTAREPDAEGFVEHLGVKIHYEVHGDGGPTILLLPTWTIVHKRFWKLQVPYLARHYRVVTYDGPGNGRSDRPLDPAPTTTTRRWRTPWPSSTPPGPTGRSWSDCPGPPTGRCELAAEHAARVLGTVLIGPRRCRSPTASDRRRGRPPGPDALPASRVPDWSQRDPLGALGEVQPRVLAGAPTTTSCGSSSASASPSRTRPSRSRTASAGAARPRRRCSSPRARRPLARPGRRVEAWCARDHHARCWRSTATTTGSARSRAQRGHRRADRRRAA